MRGLALVMVVLSATSLPTESSGSEEPSDQSEIPPLAWVATAVPGVVVHGSGHYVAGRTRTAVRLAAIEGAGLGLIVAGGVPIVLTGASRYFVAPGAVAVIGGVGLFALSFFSDVYGLAAPEGGTGAPLRFAPRVESRIGYAYVYDPQFSYRHFAVTAADLRFASLRVSPTLWVAPGGSNERWRLDAAYRLAGPLPDRRAPDGSFVDVETAGTRHTFPREGFDANTLDLALGDRLDLGRIDEALRGSFAEMAAGAAFRWVQYDPAASDADDIETLLLARLGYGFYLGGAQDNAGEMKIYYDHRHDDFAAGLQMPGLGSGVAGHFGASAEVYGGSLGVGAKTEVGSAYIATLTLLYRHLPTP